MERADRSSGSQYRCCPCRMKNDERDMPVLWHQCLLAVCQRYKNDLSQEQKSAIIDLTRVSVICWRKLCPYYFLLPVSKSLPHFSRNPTWAWVQRGRKQSYSLNGWSGYKRKWQHGILGIHYPYDSKLFVGILYFVASCYHIIVELVPVIHVESIRVSHANFILAYSAAATLFPIINSMQKLK